MYFWLMRPNDNSVKLALSESFSGLIWKVMVHISGILAVETRQKDRREILFSAFNYRTGETYFKNQVFEENPNLSLAFTGARNIILIGYKNSGTPESTGVLSVNVKDGRILWQKYNISLNQVQEQGIQVYDSRIHPKKMFWIDHLTAEPIANPSHTDDNKDIIFPEINNSFLIPSFIQHGIIAGEISVLEHSGKVFLSFHEKESGYYKQRIIVYQYNKILIDDILISGIQKLQPEAFFIQLNHLFYIRDKLEIVSYLV